MNRNKKRFNTNKTILIVAIAMIIIIPLSIFGAYELFFKIDEAPVMNPDIGKEEIIKLELVGYPSYLETLFKKNKDAWDFVLSYNIEKDQKHDINLDEYKTYKGVPLFMQWDKRWGYMEYAGEVAGTAACGPVCLSMAGYYLTRDASVFSPDKVINFAAQNGYSYDEVGTLWSLMSDGAEELGLDSEELYLDEEEIVSALRSGKPVICIMGPGVFTTVGHFIVLVGYKDGKFVVNDPNSYERSERLWAFSEFEDQVLNLWAFSRG